MGKIEGVSETAAQLCEIFGVEGCFIILYKGESENKEHFNFTLQGIDYETLKTALSLAIFHNERVRIQNEHDDIEGTF